jgi:hypothetical protein
MRYLPGRVHYSVLEHFVDSFVSKWVAICLHSFQVVEKLLKDEVEILCSEFFDRFESSGFLGEVKYTLLKRM